MKFYTDFLGEWLDTDGRNFYVWTKDTTYYSEDQKPVDIDKYIEIDDNSYYGDKEGIILVKRKG